MSSSLLSHCQGSSLCESLRVGCQISGARPVAVKKLPCGIICRRILKKEKKKKKKENVKNALSLWINDGNMLLIQRGTSVFLFLSLK